MTSKMGNKIGGVVDTDEVSIPLILKYTRVLTYCLDGQQHFQANWFGKHRKRNPH